MVARGALLTTCLVMVVARFHKIENGNRNLFFMISRTELTECLSCSLYRVKRKKRRTKKMKKYLMVLPLLALVLAGGACANGGSTAEGIGTLTLNMTDAPIDAANVEGVYISITRVEISKNAGSDEVWEELADYSSEPLEINLLDYTGGLAYQIGQFELEAGQYNQIRFHLDAPVTGQGVPTSPGCYIKFTDESTQPLFVPSGGQTGYKVVGSFEVPLNGEVEVTVDFDVRSSVVVAGPTGAPVQIPGGNTRYILKPTLRLIVNSEAGSITGTVNDESGLIATYPFVAYVYEAGDWDADEYNTPDADGKYFSNAVTSTNVDADTGEFTLAYLAQDKTYIVVIVVFNAEDGTINEIPIVEDDILLDQNMVNLGTLNTSDYTVIIPD